MEEQDNLKTLLGASDPLPEVDDEENEEMAEKALNQYMMLEVLSSIGQDNFKEIYNTMIYEIKQLPYEEQYAFCRAILDKIAKEYNFEFSREIDLLTIESIRQIYILIEFIEFNYVDFLSELLKPYNFDFKKGNSKDFVLSNYSRIEGDIESLSRNVPQIISEFLRTYNKDDLVN